MYYLQEINEKYRKKQWGKIIFEVRGMYKENELYNEHYGSVALDISWSILPTPLAVSRHLTATTSYPPLVAGKIVRRTFAAAAVEAA